MTTQTQSRPRVKPARFIRLTLAPFGKNPGVVRIKVGKEVADYFLFPLESDFGAAYRLEKFGCDVGEGYDVLLDAEEGRHSCECPGFLRWGHCKHVEGLMALRNADQL